MNGTINVKKLSIKMLDAISTLNTRVDAVPSQIKTNNRQMLATVEQNAEASSRAYTAGQYLAVNGKLYKALNNIAQGDTLQENVNIEWVLLGDEISNLRGNLKNGAYSEVVNDWNRTTAGGVLDARLGPDIKSTIDLANSMNSKVTALETIKNQMTTWKAWTPHLYDFDTFLRVLPNGQYLQIGKLYFSYFMCQDPNFNNIQSMLQIRNTPNGVNAAAGLYIGSIHNDKNKAQFYTFTSQLAGEHRVYFRPNLKSSDISNPTKPGWVTFWSLGW